MECRAIKFLNNFHQFSPFQDEHVVWEASLRWIDFDPESRVTHLSKIMRGVRLGLLSDSVSMSRTHFFFFQFNLNLLKILQYFLEKVKSHPYVENNAQVLPMIIESLRFLCDLESIWSTESEIITPAFAVPRLPHEIMFAIGGWSEGSPQSCIETYDTRADRWIRIPPYYEDPSGPRSYHRTVVLNNKIYLIGGFDGIEYFNKCSRFDPIKKIWKEIAPMHNRRCYISAVVLNGFIYAMGGYDGRHRQNTAERYCPKTNQWSFIAPMNSRRSDADACVMNGKIYITGGFNGNECLNTAECYDPLTNTWQLLPNMLSRRSGVSCVAHRSLIYVIGGFNGLTRMTSGEKFDQSRNEWTSIREMYHPRSNFGLDIIDDMIMAVGGFNGVVTISNCECYVPESDEWLEATDMSMIRSALSVSVVNGLPNLRDYVHQNRHKLFEEKRLRILENNGSSTVSFSFESVRSINTESVESIPLEADPVDEESENEELF